MSKIQQQVMAGVAVVYAVRQLTSAFAIKLYGLGISLGGIFAFVSLSNVLTNLTIVAHGGVIGVTTYLLSALVSAKLVVQVALFVGGVAAVSICIDALRSINQASTRTFATR